MSECIEKIVDKNVLFLITARGGSKGVPRKNIREVGGLPLIAYKILAAKKCPCKNKRIIVSTEDKEIADIAIAYGAEVPFVRPQELASDEANSIDVVLHAMNWIMEHDSVVYDYICLLEPSSPLATGSDLNRALQKIIDKDADTLLSMKEVELNSVFIHELDEQGGLSLFYYAIKSLSDLRRQGQKKQYTMNGCMYISKWEYFEKNRTFHSVNSVPYIMAGEVSIEVDSMDDFERLCYLVESGSIDTSEWRLD